MGQAIIRILIVDDFEPWRRFIRLTLLASEKLQVIGEVSDGLEAVQKAHQLQPDLILLDIGLPKLNGIEAARRIQEVSPTSKILYVSENRSSDIVEEALRTAACGYVLKSSAGSELLSAVGVVVQGKRFVSASLGAGGPENQHGDGPKPTVVTSPLPPRNVRHEVAFYREEMGLVHGFARVATAVLRSGSPVVVIATQPHLLAIVEKLRNDDVDLDAAMDQGKYVQLDARDTLSKVMVNDHPDPDRCANVVGELVVGVSKRTNGQSRRVAICGECAPSLLAEGNTEGAIQLEHLWDEVTRRYHADTLCGYLRNTFAATQTTLFHRICAEHSAIQGRELGY